MLEDVITTHGELLEAAHVQSRLVATVSDPDPPAADAVSLEFVTVTRHFEADGPVSETSDELHAMLANSRAVST